MRSNPKASLTGPRPWSASRWARPATLAYWLALACTTHWPNLALGDAKTGLPGFSTDKLLHFGAFAILTLLLVYARPLGSRGFLANLLAAAVLSAAYAFLDEHTQPWFERHFSPADTIGNLIGVVFVFLVLFLGQTDRPVPLRRLWLHRSAMIVVGSCLGWHLFTINLPEARGQHLVGAMVFTWLLAAARLAGRGRPALNVLTCSVFSAALGVLIAQVHARGAPRMQAHLVYVYQTGLLLALWVWALWALARFFVRGESDAASWPSILELPAKTAATGCSTEPRPDGSQAASGRFVGHAVRVSVLTVVSRITGLVRDAVLASVFGMGAIMDAFFLGFLVPNLFRRLFGEGALSAAFIPVYSDLIRKDKLSARRLASMCLALLFVVLGAATLIGEGILAWLAASAAASPDTALTLRLGMIMLPYMPMICLVAVIGGMLQVHGRFGPPAAAPIVLNLTLIAGIFMATTGFRGDDALRQAISIVAVCVLVAGFLQLLWQVLAVLEVERFTARLGGSAALLRPVAVAMLPMLVGLAVFQINAFMDSLIAWWFSPKQAGPQLLSVFGWQVPHPIEKGSVAALHWSQRLYQFPLGVFGIAIATAIFPALAASASSTECDRTGFSQILRQGLRLTVFIGLPASAGLVLVRVPLVRLIYERGHFSSEQTLRVAAILAGYGSAVWAYSMTHVLTRAFYAARDARTPMRISLLMVCLNLLLNLILIWHLKAAGLAWSTAICAAIQVVLLLIAIRRHAPAPVDAAVWSGWRRSIVLTASMSVVVGLIAWIVKPAEQGPVVSGLVLAAMVLAGVGVYLVGAWWMGVEELRWLLRREVRNADIEIRKNCE